MNEQIISKIPEKGAVDGWVMIKQAFSKTATTDKPYVQWEGLDLSGTLVRGSIFSDDGTVIDASVLKSGQVWHVTGIMGMARNGLQVFNSVLERVELPTDIHWFKARCLPTLPVEDYNQMLADVRGYADSIVDPALKQLSDAFWRYWLPYLPGTPAGRSVHEAYRGGLLRHTWDVLKIIDNPSTWKHPVNRDLLIFCAIYHDIGKVRAYTDEMTITFEGKLIPHTFLAYELIMQAILGLGIHIDPKLLVQLKHCFITHHGEFSEIEPMTREAQLIHRADMVAAGLGHFAEIVKGTINTEGWGSYDSVLKGYPYFPEKDFAVCN